ISTTSSRIFGRHSKPQPAFAPLRNRGIAMGGGYRTAARSAILAAGAIAAAVGFAPMTAGAGVAEGKAALERYDYHSALAEFSDAAAGNDREAQYQLGLLYMLGHGGITQDYARSAHWFARAAEGGHGMAAYMLANQYA